MVRVGVRLELVLRPSHKANKPCHTFGWCWLTMTGYVKQLLGLELRWHHTARNFRATMLAVILSMAWFVGQQDMVW